MGNILKGQLMDSLIARVNASSRQGKVVTKKIVSIIKELEDCHDAERIKEIQSLVMDLEPTVETGEVITWGIFNNFLNEFCDNLTLKIMRGKYLSGKDDRSLINLLKKADSLKIAYDDPVIAMAELKKLKEDPKGKKNVTE